MRIHGWLVMGSVLVAGVGCVKDNPRACGPGDPCTNPAFPFCDLDGIVGGLPGNCLAVDCTPGDFVACDADQALQCNATGDNYDSVLCERGCDPLSNGCRLCNPNETACTNGVTATCDASGAVVETTPCPLGCFESEPRCSQVDPSNGLATYLDMAATAAPIEALGPLVVDTLNGTIFSTDIDGNLGIPSFLLPAPSGGVAVRVYVVSRATVGSIWFGNGLPLNDPVPAAAFVSAGDFIINETVNASVAYPSQSELGPYAPGSVVSGPCVGETGRIVQMGSTLHVVGAGGGGNASAGSQGGGVQDGVLIGGEGGAPHGADTIEPLVGGCAGGPLRNAAGGLVAAYTGAGGGAIQIVSGTRIVLTQGAGILANGAGGYAQFEGAAAGGAGGAILLEAPVVDLGQGVALTANGGSGSGGNVTVGVTPGYDGQRSTSRAPGVLPTGADCPAPAVCALSGAGGALSGPPTDGGNTGFDPDDDRFAGGGGGAAGRIRINTRDGTYTKGNDVIESPAPIAGTLRTR